MGAILSPIAVPVLQHIAADRAEEQTALAAHRSIRFHSSLFDAFSSREPVSTRIKCGAGFRSKTL
jgi:hypothetical protein